jgi:NitT/TauT family transport system substrate-binding protein
MKRMIFAALAATVLLLGLSGCWSSPENPDEIKVGVHAWPGGGPIYIGEKMGFFDSVNIDLKISKIENFDSKRAALVSGQIDIDVANTMDQLLIYHEAGFPAQIMAVTDESVGGDGLVAKEGIQRISDLAGKTVAFAEASPSDFFLRYLLSKHGVPASSVVLKPVADPQIAGNAVIAGQVDAAVTYEPFLSQASKAPGNRLLASTAEYPALIPGLLITNGDKAKANQELYRRFLRAWFRSVDYFNAQRKAAYSIIAEGMGMKAEEVEEILSVVEIQTLDQNKVLFAPSSRDNVAVLLAEIQKFWKANGFIKKQADPKTFILFHSIQP